MLDIQGAVHGRLNADAALIALLDSYKDKDGTSLGPAVFTSAMPSDHKPGPDPSIIIRAPSNNLSDDTASEQNRDVTIPIVVYAAPDGSNLPLVQSAEAVRASLKTWLRETISGAVYQVASVTGPDDAPSTDPSVDGLLLSVRLLIQES